MPDLYYKSALAELWLGDSLELMRSLYGPSFLHSIVTSVPYFGKLNYRHNRQVGLEKKVDDYCAALLRHFSGYYQLLLPGGALMLNVGETWNNLSAVSEHKRQSKEKRFTRQEGRRDLQDDADEKEALQIPDRVLKTALQAGFLLRDTYIWIKGKDEESGSGRPTGSDRSANAWEPIYYLRKPTGKRRYYAAYWDGQHLPTNVICCPPAGHTVHPCPFPKPLVRKLVLATCPPGGMVGDFFSGVCTVSDVAQAEGRQSLSCELNDEYLKYAVDSLGPLFGAVA